MPFLKKTLNYDNFGMEKVFQIMHSDYKLKSRWDILTNSLIYINRYEILSHKR